MIYFDVTQAREAKHRSGLVRVSTRLRAELGIRAVALPWHEVEARAKPTDWFLTAELFSEEERPGFAAFLARRTCRLAAIYHDSIPLKYPESTWPKSVARHPHYLGLLAQFDRIFAVSAASRAELLEFWAWQGVTARASVGEIGLGSDFAGQPRILRRPAAARRSLLSVGILEPRKNQLFLLGVCEQLWSEGLRFDLNLVGRVNPHFGQPIVRRIRELSKRCPGLHHFERADDRQVAELYGQALISLFPTLAEGCGLPLLESLWLGVPCLASDLPPLVENARGGGCISLPANDAVAWEHAIRKILSDEGAVADLEIGATNRSLPTWAETADSLGRALA